MFSELAQRHIGRGSADPQSTTDAHGFFDGDGVMFSRCRLRMDQLSENVRLLIGLPGEMLESDDAAKLQYIMQVLTPWIDSKCTTRHPVVGLVGVDSAYFAKRDAKREGEPIHPVQFELAHLLTDAKRYQEMSAWPSPVISVQEIALHGCV